MDSKISPQFWADLGGQPSEVKLTMLWAITNAETAASLVGAFTWRPRQFEFDTELDAECFATTCRVLPRAMVVEGDRVWLRHYIAYQFGRGDRLVKNNMAKALAKPFGGLPMPLQERLLDMYPELKPLLTPQQALGKPFATIEAEWVPESGPAPQEPLLVLPGEALRRGREEKSSKEKSSLGGAGGGAGKDEGSRLKAEVGGGPGAVVPGEAEVLGFARGWAGDAARGIPAVMPEGYVLSWLAWRLGESAPPFPRDWPADLTRRFVADWVKKRADTRHGVAAGAKAPPAADPAELVQALSRENDPVRRRQILERMKAVPA